MSELTIGGSRFRPLSDHVLVKLDKLEKVSAGGIIIPATASKESNFKGEICVVSKYDTDNDTDYKVGRKVITSKNSGMPVVFDDNFGAEYKLFNKAEIRYVF